jgi:hypothetical protein
VIFAPVTAVTLGASDLGRIVNGRDGDPDEKHPFLFFFRKPKVLAAWQKIGAMVLTRACLKHPEVRGWRPRPGCGKSRGARRLAQNNQAYLTEAGYN